MLAADQGGVHKEKSVLFVFQFPVMASGDDLQKIHCQSVALPVIIVAKRRIFDDAHPEDGRRQNGGGQDEKEDVCN